MTSLTCWKKIKEFLKRILALEKIIINTYFHITIFIINLAHCILILINLNYTTNEKLQDNLYIIETCFLVIYCIESFSKIAVFNFRGYIKDPWNAFDLFLIFC